jgi:enterochelin esterase-like enzyme
MAEQYAKGAKFPVCFFLSTGKDEPAQSGLVDGLKANRRMRDALVGHGYDVKYEEIEGQHDPINWRLTLPDGLIALDSVPAR